MLTDKLTKDEADLLYKPLSDDSSTHTRTLLYTNDVIGNYEDIVLSESWHNFDEIHTTSGWGDYLTPNSLDVKGMLEAFGADDVYTRIQLVKFGQDGWYFVTPSDDGLILAYSGRSDAVTIRSIYGVKLG